MACNVGQGPDELIRAGLVVDGLVGKYLRNAARIVKAADDATPRT